jgi:hypothetical protein
MGPGDDNKLLALAISGKIEIRIIKEKIQENDVFNVFIKISTAVIFDNKMR